MPSSGNKIYDSGIPQSQFANINLNPLQGQAKIILRGTDYTRAHCQLLYSLSKWETLMDSRKSEIGTSLKLVIVRVIILFQSDWEILRVFSYLNWVNYLALSSANISSVKCFAYKRTIQLARNTHSVFRRMTSLSSPCKIFPRSR